MQTPNGASGDFRVNEIFIVFGIWSVFVQRGGVFTRLTRETLVKFRQTANLFEQFCTNFEERSKDFDKFCIFGGRGRNS